MLTSEKLKVIDLKLEEINQKVRQLEEIKIICLLNGIAVLKQLQAEHLSQQN